MDVQGLSYMLMIIKILVISILAAKDTVALCYLEPDKVMDSLYDGSFDSYCRPGQLRDLSTRKCYNIVYIDIAMPYINNCTLGLRCPLCTRRSNVVADKQCTRVQVGTCTCIDPSMVMSRDGKRCYLPIPTTPTTQVSSYAASTYKTAITNFSTYQTATTNFPTYQTDSDVTDLITVETSQSTKKAPSGCVNNMTYIKPAKCECTSQNWNIVQGIIICVCLFVLAVVSGILIYHIVVYRRKNIKDTNNVNRKPSMQNGAVLSAADIVSEDITKYNIKSCTAVTLVDKRRAYVDQDIAKAKEFAEKFPGGLPEERYKEIEATSETDVLEKIDSISRMDDLGDILLFFVLCHGGEDGIKCVNSQGTSYLEPDEVYKRFFANNCKALIGKPKVFVFLNCRGSEIAKHITTSSQANANLPIVGSAGIPVFSSEDMSDVFLIFGSAPGHQCFFEVQGTSWLLQELCNVAENHPLKNLCSIITGVIRNVKMKRGYDQKKKVNGVAQLPNFHSYCDKEIYLNTNLPIDRLSIQDEEAGKLDEASGGSKSTDGSEETLLSSSTEDMYSTTV